MITRLFRRFERIIVNNLQVLSPTLQRQKPSLVRHTMAASNGALAKIIQRQENEIMHLRLQLERYSSCFVPKPIGYSQLSEILKIANIIAAFVKININPKADNHVVYRILYQKCCGRLYYISKGNQNSSEDGIPLKLKQDLMQKLKKNAASLGIDLSHCEDNWIAETIVSIAYRNHKIKYITKIAAPSYIDASRGLVNYRNFIKKKSI